MFVTAPANDTVTLARLRSGLAAKSLTSTLTVFPSSGKETMDHCYGFSVTFSMMQWLFRKRKPTIRSSSSRPLEKAVNVSRSFVGF